MARLASMGLELEEIAVENRITLPDLVELAEDRGRPASHYLAAIPLATELELASSSGVEVRVCAGNCQRYGALDLLDHLVERSGKGRPFGIRPVECLDHCDTGPACELHGEHGKLVLAPATASKIDEALDSL
ncbi:MAG: (2Fe-2S) ferredoxin domain-containing protein [Deltaproteobacteria bacterium]|nr:(2Fe-2S) ferredoxin domain-containing protein [Deltaproteobacteria bacterium]